MDKLEFAARIYELRTAKGISQKELGELLGVSNKAVSKWENGESIPKTETLVKISEVFGIDIGELMGTAPESAPETKSTPAHSNETDALKAENARLRAQIVQSNKKKKGRLLLAVLLCAAAIAAAGVFAFFSGSPHTDNKGVKDLGKEGTAISFSGKKFEPFSPLDEIVYKNTIDFILYDSKEAQYTDLAGKKHTVLISCERYLDYISVSQGSKTYFYIPSDGHVEIKAKNIDYINLLTGKTIVGRENYTSYKRYNNDDTTQQKMIACFAAFYNNKTETADKRATDLYLGNKSAVVEVSFNESTDWQWAEIGEFFVDGKGNAYFYDYTDAKTYDVGKEMAQYVKAN